MTTQPKPGFPQDTPGWKPVPDPTSLTQEALRDSEVQMRRELEMSIEVINTRLSAMDQAILLRLHGLDRIYPGEIEKMISHMKQIHDQDVENISLRFLERDVRTAQAAESSQKALDAALLAAAALVAQQNEANQQNSAQQNEANARAAEKVETSTTKQIDGIVTLISTTAQASDQKFTDLKERIDRTEGIAAGGSGARDNNRALASIVIAAMGVLLVLGSVVVTIIVARGGK